MRRAIVVALAFALTACELRDSQPKGQPGNDAAQSGQPVEQALPADVRPTPPHAERFGAIGRVAQDAEVRAWDIDANPTGAGLPKGSGTYQRGVTVYAQQCASCHGAKGEGIAPSPRLIGPEPRDFSFAADAKLVKTIGNYWPYATTLYDYINRAMPFQAPGSLPPGDVYSVVAFLLAENGIVDKSTVIDARSLPRVRMPGRDHFVVDDRKGGAGFR
jgi:S-disulfanyl-L-cysteine oxidoreductase SoxD